jgi:thiamine biosynthesis lipoprotein
MPEATLIRFASRAMGSPLRLTVPPEAVDDEQAAAEAWAEVVDEFEASEQAMSRFRDTSELTELNRAAGTGRAVAVGRRLERALVASDRARRVTGGRFDPRVLADLDRLGYRGAALPIRDVDGNGSQAEAVVHRLGRRRLRIERPVDLGGIGKGLALRWAAARLDRRGLRSFLLEAGGDLVARGPGPVGDSWRVGIEAPSGVDAPLAVIAAGELAVTTSSVGVHAWLVHGRSVHHLIDPATGQPGGDGLAAVTVAAHDPAWAEVWSKTLFLTGHARVAELARARGLAAWWIDADQSLSMTPAARVRTVWVAAEA